MANEQGLFTVAEEDFEKELFVVAEEEEEPKKPVPPEFPHEIPRSPLPVRPPQVEQIPVQPQPPEKMPVRPGQEQPKQDADDWRNSKDVEKFTQFLYNEMQRIGKPAQWRTQTEKERGLGQLKRLNHYISEALRNDYDSHLDVSKIDQARNMVERYIDEAEMAIEGIRNMRKQRKQMRRGEQENDITKEATAPHFNGLQVNISAFERAICGALINGKIAGGRNIEELYTEAKKKYGFNPREELAILQILADFGYPIFADRLRLGENNDPTRTEGWGEWSSQYYA